MKKNGFKYEVEFERNKKCISFTVFKLLSQEHAPFCKCLNPFLIPSGIQTIL